MASKARGGSLLPSPLDSVGADIIILSSSDKDDNARQTPDLIELITDRDEEGDSDSDQENAQKIEVKIETTSSKVVRDEIKDKE